VDKADIYDVHRAASMQIGYESSGSADFLWTKMHDGGEHMLLLGGGSEMAAVNLKVMYVISDLYSYVKNCANPEQVLAAAAYNALMSRTINTTLDSFLNVDRNSLSVSVLDELSEFCKSEGLGLSVVQIIIENIHPPVDLADVYQKVVSASVDKNTTIANAHIYAQKRILDAERQSKVAVETARAVQYNRISDAQKETAVYYAAAEAYGISGGAFELTKYLDVYEKIINGHKVYVFSPGTVSSISKFIIGRVSTVERPDVFIGED
jgi:membrane protease subunit HflK